MLHSSAGRFGADLQLLAIAAGLERWHPIVVLPHRGPLGSLLSDAGVEVVVTPLAVLRRGAVGPRLAAAARQSRKGLRRLAVARGASVVHSNTSVVLGGGSLGLPHLVHVREIYQGVPGARLYPLFRRHLERADALACVSEAVARQFRRRAFVVHDGLTRATLPRPREEARTALDLPPERFVVALLGRVSDWKGQDVLARALASPPMAEIGAIGLVAGDAFHGRHDAALRKLHAELALGDRLRLLGFRDDLDVIFGAADAVAVPSKRPDPFPNAALEAGAAGLPVVAANTGGLPEIVSDGETGRLVPPGDSAALAAALRPLANDPAAARAMGERAAASIPQRFPMARAIAQIEDCYDRLAG